MWEAARAELADLIENPSRVSERKGAIPKEIVLHQNYPNPFNPATTIAFSILQPGFVTLKIFNLRDEEVAKLMVEELPPGEYSTEWHPKRLASGVYYYRLSLRRPPNSRIATKKLLLLK
ncbi:MAG: hypothetical protein ACE5NG_12510 [bacterium]